MYRIYTTGSTENNPLEAGPQVLIALSPLLPLASTSSD
jgi:hypothetical protein